MRIVMRQSVNRFLRDHIIEVGLNGEITEAYANNLIARGYADVLGDSRSVRPQSPSTATDEPPKRKRKPRGPKPVESVTEVPVETPVEVTETEEPEAVESTEPATENPE